MRPAELAMPGDVYAGLAERYDRFHGPFGEQNPREVAFFRTLFRENRVQCVLDCACGTGRHLYMAQALGRQVTGSDRSPSMLARAVENLAAQGLRLPLVQADYRALPLPQGRAFDAVLCLSSSLLHMPGEEEAVCALRSMRRVLRRGGVLVLTQGTTDKQWAAKPRFLLAVDERDFSRLFVIDYEGEGATYHLLDITHGVETQGLEVWSVHYPRVYLRDDQERLLGEAGFRRVEFYGSYGLDRYDKDTSDLLIAVAWA